MGVLVTKGEAKKEYEAETMCLTIKFQKIDNDAGHALTTVKRDCENFMASLEKINILPEKVKIKDYGVSENYGSKNELEAKRYIVIDTKIDIHLCTYIFSLIEKNEKDIRYNISFDLIDKEQKSNEVLNLAIEDSRRQAEVIATALGKKIVGVSSVNEDKYVRRPCAKSVEIKEDINPEIPEAFKSDTPLSDRAALPTIKVEEEIEIKWEMD